MAECAIGDALGSFCLNQFDSSCWFDERTVNSGLVNSFFKLLEFVSTTTKLKVRFEKVSGSMDCVVMRFCPYYMQNEYSNEL